MLIVNNLFDIMNYKKDKKHNNCDYKIPINTENAEKIFNYFDQASDFLRNIEIEVERKKRIVRIPLLKSQSRMTSFGFINNMISIKGLICGN